MDREKYVIPFRALFPRADGSMFYRVVPSTLSSYQMHEVDHSGPRSRLFFTTRAVVFERVEGPRPDIKFRGPYFREKVQQVNPVRKAAGEGRKK